MELIRHIPYRGFVFRQYNPAGELNIALTISAVFSIKTDGGLELLKEQSEILLADDYIGTKTRPHEHLIRQADFIPYKPGTDVTVLARAWAPSGQPEKSWLAGIKIAEREKILRIHGRRDWCPDRENGWVMGEAEPTDFVPLAYYKAFGGLIPKDETAENKEPQDCHRFNPLGPGLLSECLNDRTTSYPAPQIEDVDDPITDWKHDYTPQGVAPIVPVWRFREQYCGTYDETWLKTRHPFLPPDFDYRFYQCAHPDLIFTPHLAGDECVQLANLYHKNKRLKILLPGKHLGAVITRKNGAREKGRMALDGVHFDLLSDLATLRLTWRVGFSWGVGVKTVDVGFVSPPAKQAPGQKELASHV